jgi:putative SOS response-associated peptidase YedK
MAWRRTATEQELLALLRLCPDESLKIWPVHNNVGNAHNTGVELVLPERRRLRLSGSRQTGGS